MALAKAGIPVFCVDEKTGMQALERETPGSPTRPGRPRRHDHRYRRHGSTLFVGAFQVHSGKVWGRFVDSRDGPTFAAFIREVCESVPGAPAIHFVMDQLSTHSTPELCEVVAEFSGVSCDPKKLETPRLRKAWLRDTNKRVVFHYTPLRGSWLDQIEIWFSTLSRKLLQLESFTSLVDLQTKVYEFVEYYNRHSAHPFRWTYTGGVCRREVALQAGREGVASPGGKTRAESGGAGRAPCPRRGIEGRVSPPRPGRPARRVEARAARPAREEASEGGCGAWVGGRAFAGVWRRRTWHATHEAWSLFAFCSQTKPL